MDKIAFIEKFTASVNAPGSALTPKHSEIVSWLEGYIKQNRRKWHYFTGPQFRFFFFLCNAITLGIFNRIFKKTLLWNMYFRSKITGAAIEKIYDNFGSDVIDFSTDTPLFFYGGTLGDKGYWLITAEKVAFKMFGGKGFGDQTKVASKVGVYKFSEIKSITLDPSGWTKVGIGVSVDGESVGALYYDERKVGANALTGVFNYLISKAK